MYDHVKALPPSRRSQLCLSWRDLTPDSRRLFVLLEIPLWFSALSQAYRRDDLWFGLGFFAILSVLTFVLTWELGTRCASSNHGTYFRDTEPRRYWMSVGVTALFWIVFVMAGYCS